MEQPPITWALLVSHLVLLLLAASIVAQEAEDETEFSYIPCSPNGPMNWGDLKEEWATCKTGEMQSPNNLAQMKVAKILESQKLFKSYNPGEAILKNRGYDISVQWQGNGSKIQINGTNYFLRQCHWHHPSEHTINGRRYALELHIVHESADNKVAVIGSVYNIGEPNPFLSKLAQKLETICQPSKEVYAGVIDPEDVINVEGDQYYRYMGSLTTPPCTEGVVWTIYKQAGTVSQKQVDLLQKAVNDDAEENARPLQAINGRKVQLYKQKGHHEKTSIRTPVVKSVDVIYQQN